MNNETKNILMIARNKKVEALRMATGLTHFVFLQIVIGALVAGIDAGRSYNEWPLMGGAFVPPTAFDLEPLWRNFFENAGLVQFMHRVTGYLLFAFGVVVWWRSRGSGNSETRFAFNAVLGVMVVQMGIGIMTVLYSAPWQMAILHQFVAVLLYVAVLRARFLAQYPKAQSVRGRT